MNGFQCGILLWLMLDMKPRILNSLAILTYFILIITPLLLAFDRLVWVAGFEPINWLNSLERNFISNGVLMFTISQAIFSTLVTIAIGLPIAWQLGRYNWKYESLIKATLTMPFVMPSIVVAMGFLQIVGSSGLDIRSNQSTWFVTLLIAHAWFNMALVIRFCEPVLSQLSPKYLEQIRLLPGGKTSFLRLKNFWLPILLPSIIASACMTFVFSFTSFALVKWITLGENTLESMMASIGSSAGISGYMINHNQIILGSSLIQFTVLGLSLWIMSTIQQKRQKQISQSSEKIVKKKNTAGWMVLGPGLLFATLPLITVFISSFRVRQINGKDVTYSWETSGWKYAFESTNSLGSANDALLNSIGYAMISLLIAIPLSWFIANTICDIEKSKPIAARLLDLFVMLPFAVSSVMIGLGVMLGMIKINAEFFYSIWITPVIAHVMITTPFAVRIILSSLRSMKPELDECGMVLGLNGFERFYRIKLPMMKNTIIIASIFTIAMSLGEFGASWVVTRNSDWITLPILIDSLRGMPFNNSLTIPASCAVASVLMMISIAIFTLAEKFRKNVNGGMF